jgi:hypothetical protein
MSDLELPDNNSRRSEEIRIAESAFTAAGERTRRFRREELETAPSLSLRFLRVLSPAAVKTACFSLIAAFLSLSLNVAHGQEPQARIKIDIDRAIGEVHSHLFGNFAAHLGRMIYGGIYEEGGNTSTSPPHITRGSGRCT